MTVRKNPARKLQMTNELRHPTQVVSIRDQRLNALIRASANRNSPNASALFDIPMA